MSYVGAEGRVPAEFGPVAAKDSRPPPIPDHQLLRRIGGGSYGEVWLARCVMGSFRAVKVVHRARFEHDRPFQREYEGIQKFEPVSRSHEGLMDILQVGRNDPAGYFYYVMELADDAGAERSDGVLESSGDAQTHGPQDATAPTLQPSNPPTLLDPVAYAPKTVKSELYHLGRLPLAECLRLGLLLTDAVGHLHQHGLIHRDIKPSNIIFVHGVPKLADIGLVAGVGQTVSCVGTEGFIPPEGPGTPQADLYSLGKVLYEISTGKDRQDYPEPLTNLAELREQDGLLELNEVILKACAPDARTRYQSAQQMHDDLMLVQSGKSLKRLHSIERRLAIATKLGAVIALLALLAGGAYFHANRAEKKATERLVRLYVASAMHLVDEGDLLGALPWIAESLRLAKGNPAAEEMQRYRFEAVWRQCPKLRSLCLHEKRIYDAAFSPDGRRLATASADHTARVWDVATGQPVMPPLAHEDEVRHVAFSPDGHRLVTVSHAGVMRIWNTTTGELLCPPVPHQLEVGSVKFSPDSLRILTSSGAIRISGHEITRRQLPTGQDVNVPRTPTESIGEAQVWEAATGRPLSRPLRHAGRVHHAAFSPDGKKIVTASEDRTAMIWDANTSEPIAPALHHGGKVRHAEFSPDGGHVLTASEDETAQVWDVATGQPLGPPLRHANDLLYATFSPDGRQIATASRDQTACLWDASTGRLLCPPLRHDGDVRYAQFSPDGRWLMTAGSEQAVRIWDVAGGELLARLAHNNSGTYAAFSPEGSGLVTISRDGVARLWDLSPANVKLQHDDVVVSAAFNPDGNHVLTASVDQTARVWDAATGQAVTPVLADPEATTRYAGFSARFSPDGRRVVTAGSFTTRLYDATRGRLTCPPIPQGKAFHAACSPDGRRVVTASTTGTARIWDAVTGAPVTPPLQHESAVWVAAFSPDGRWLVTGCGDYEAPDKGAFRVWDALTGQPASPPVRLRGRVRQVCFSTDGQLVLTACTNPAMDEREAQLWNWRTAKEVTPPLRHGDGVSHAEFSPDGRRILTASLDKTARIWDAKTGQPLTPALTHDRQVEHAAFSPDGRRVVTASSDGTARVWDATTGEPISPPLKHGGAVWQARFSPDGRRVVTASEDHTARVWDVPKTDWPLPDLLRLAELLSGQQIDSNGNAVAVRPEELRKTWQALRASRFPRCQREVDD